MLARNVEEAWESGTRSDEDGVETFLMHELVDRDGLADYNVSFEDHTAATEDIDFVMNNLLGKTELGNAVDQHSPELVEPRRRGLDGPSG